MRQNLPQFFYKNGELKICELFEFPVFLKGFDKESDKIAIKAIKT